MSSPPPTPDAEGGEPKGDEPDEPEMKGPLRRCLATREVLPKEAMIRFVVGPENQVVPDLTGRLPGRGMWLKADARALETALKKGGFSRAAKGGVKVPDNLAEVLRYLLSERLADLLGMARRAGAAVAGFQKVQEWLQAKRVGVLVEATDGSEAERARLVGRAELPVVVALPRERMGQAFGREAAVHVAIAPGKLADAIRQEASRLSGLSPAD
ncbi:RNA-binding protein [Rhodovarius crocodyli]|nr:RNA-binding protein [Rhodovarius crocodyli]